MRTKILPIIGFIKHYIVFILVITVLAIVSFFVFRINQLSSVTPTDDAVSEKLKTVQRPKIDQNALDKIQQLKGQNIEVQSLFDRATTNPFSE